MRALLPLGLLLALGACGIGPYRVAPDTPVNVAYRCDDGQTPVVRYFGLTPEQATIRLDDGRAVELVGHPAESSDHFTGNGVTLDTTEGQATLEVNGKRTSCHARG